MNQIILYKFGFVIGVWHMYYMHWYFTLHNKLAKLYKFR